VVATGREYSLRKFVCETFRQLGLNWEKHVKPDSSLCRPSDIKRSCGNASKARHRLGWKPVVGFEDLIRRLVAAEIDSRTVI
jgi:GDPmannose 4,6-dehydratase